MGKRACLVLYDDELSKYKVTELDPDQGGSADANLVNLIWGNFGISIKDNWDDTILEIRSVLRHLH